MRLYKNRKLAALMAAAMRCTAAVPFAGAHSGDTDANGGHWDSSIGEYHYHHGYAVHQHPNGVCPYALIAQSSSSSAEPLSPAIEVARQAAAATDEERLEVNDYGPEAEEEFETKREAFTSGFDSGVEYSRDEDINGNAYHEGYDTGYEEGYYYSKEDSYDGAYREGYEEGYREGGRTNPDAPDNDLIDRSEISTSSATAVPVQKATTHSWLRYAPFIIAALVGVCILAFILVHIDLKNYHNAENRCDQYYFVLRDIATIAKTRPVSAEEIDSVLKKI